MVIAFVSYFGAKLHRPRLIAIGCLVMAVGTYLTALPHFLQGLSVHSCFHNLDQFFISKMFTASWWSSTFLTNPCCLCPSSYKYETSVSHNALVNSSENVLPCHSNHSLQEAEGTELRDQSGTQQTRCKSKTLPAAFSYSRLISHPQLVKRKQALIYGSTCLWETCCVGLGRLPSCLWVFPIWMTSPEKRTLHSI